MPGVSHMKWKGKGEDLKSLKEIQGQDWATHKKKERDEKAAMSTILLTAPPAAISHASTSLIWSVSFSAKSV